MKLRHILFSLLFILPSISFAQTDYALQGFTYSMAVPMGASADYTNDGSFRGANYEGYYGLTSNFTLGWLFGWNVFNSKLINETYTNENISLTGNQYRYQNEFPMLLRALYLFGVEDGIRPFAGAGFGVIYDIRRTDIGLYSLKTDAWHFTMAPELGIIIPVGENALTTSIRYNYGVKTKSLENQSYISFNVGVLFVP